MVSVEIHSSCKSLLILLVSVLCRTAKNKYSFTREQCYAFQKVRTNQLDFAEPGVGKEMLYMALTGIFYFFLTLLIEVCSRTGWTA